MKKWTWKALALQECVTVAKMKEAVLKPKERKRKTRVTGEWKPMGLSELWKPIPSHLKVALSELWKPIPSHLKVRKEKSGNLDAPKQPTPMPTALKEPTLISLPSKEL